MTPGKVVLVSLICLALSLLGSATNDKYSGFMSLKSGNYKVAKVISVPEFRTSGLWVMNNELYAMTLVIEDDDTRKSRLYVYNIRDYTLSRKIEIPQVSHPNGLVGSACGNMLYISSYYSGYFYTLDLSNNNTVKSWKLKCYECSNEKQQISITPNGNLLIGLPLSYYVRSLLVEYSPILAPVYTKTLTWLASPVGHVIKLFNGNYIFCKQRAFQTLPDILLMDRDGNILKSYRKQSTKSDYVFYNPQYLAVDEFGNILVFDFGKSDYKLILLTPSLKYAADIKSFGIDKFLPYRFHYDSGKGVLYVAMDDGIIIVLKLH